MTGHLLGGAGARGVGAHRAALHDRLAPPTINLENRTRRSRSTRAGSRASCREGQIVALNNSFGFGGHNAVVAIRSI